MVFFRFLSRLPLRVLYGISDVVYFLLRYVVRYRYQVIQENLRLAFPEKSTAEIRTITKRFYRNLTDILAETIKLPAMSPGELMKRVRFTNADVVKKWLDAGQSVVGMASHQANWEWLPSAAVLYGMAVDSIYKPLTNPFFENLMKVIRSSFGAVPVPMQSLPRRLAIQKNVPRIIALVADQIPNVPEQAYWTNFLNRDTAFYPGTERLARSRNMPVFYTELVRVGRGYYEATFKLVGEPPYDNLPQGSMIERYRDFLEETIQIYPSDWLWSHKRWKHWRDEYQKIRTKLE